jgi:hypothetical protein
LRPLDLHGRTVEIDERLVERISRRRRRGHHDAGEAGDDLVAWREKWN